MIHLTFIGMLWVWQAVPRSWTPAPAIYEVALVSQRVQAAPVTASAAVAPQPPPATTAPVNPVVTPSTIPKAEKPKPEPIKKAPAPASASTPAPGATKPPVPTASAGESSGKAGAGNLVGIGSTTSRMTIDSPNFPFAYYLNLIRFRLQENWQPPPTKRGQMNTMVKFQILKNGSIIGIQMEKSSGQFMFDQSALRAVHSSNPLPALPDDFTEDHLTVHIEFEGR